MHSRSAAKASEIITVHRVQVSCSLCETSREIKCIRISSSQPYQLMLGHSSLSSLLSSMSWKTALILDYRMSPPTDLCGLRKEDCAPSSTQWNPLSSCTGPQVELGVWELFEHPGGLPTSGWRCCWQELAGGELLQAWLRNKWCGTTTISRQEGKGYRQRDEWRGGVK